jgi:hypothetical protein
MTTNYGNLNSLSLSLCDIAMVVLKHVNPNCILTLTLTLTPKEPEQPQSATIEDLTYRSSNIFPDWITSNTEWRGAKKMNSGSIQEVLSKPLGQRSHDQNVAVINFVMNSWEQANLLGHRRTTQLFKDFKQVTHVKGDTHSLSLSLSLSHSLSISLSLSLSHSHFLSLSLTLSLSLSLSLTLTLTFSLSLTLTFSLSLSLSLPLFLSHSLSLSNPR